MNSFVYDIGERARKTSRFIAHVRAEIQYALLEEKKARKFTQQALAEKLGVNRSVVNRQIMGEENLTLRSVADLAWALGWEPHFSLAKPQAIEGDNYYIERADPIKVSEAHTSISSPEINQTWLFVQNGPSPVAVT